MTIKNIAHFFYSFGSLKNLKNKVLAFKMSESQVHLEMKPIKFDKNIHIIKWKRCSVKDTLIPNPRKSNMNHDYLRENENERKRHKLLFLFLTSLWCEQENVRK